MTADGSATMRAPDALPALQYAPLYWLALGKLAVGTEGFMGAAIGSHRVIRACLPILATARPARA